MFPWFLTEKRAPRFPYRDRIKESAQLKNSIFVQLKTEGCQSITLNCLQSWFPSKEQVKKYSNLYKLNLFSWRNFKINLVRSCSIVFFFFFLYVFSFFLCFLYVLWMFAMMYFILFTLHWMTMEYCLKWFILDTFSVIFCYGETFVFIFYANCHVATAYRQADWQGVDMIHSSLIFLSHVCYVIYYFWIRIT